MSPGVSGAPSTGAPRLAGPNPRLRMGRLATSSPFALARPGHVGREQAAVQGQEPRPGRDPDPASTEAPCVHGLMNADGNPRSGGKDLVDPGNEAVVSPIVTLGRGGADGEARPHRVHADGGGHQEQKALVFVGVSGAPDAVHGERGGHGGGDVSRRERLLGVVVVLQSSQHAVEHHGLGRGDDALRERGVAVVVVAIGREHRGPDREGQVGDPERRHRCADGEVLAVVGSGPIREAQHHQADQEQGGASQHVSFPTHHPSRGSGLP